MQHTLQHPVGLFHLAVAVLAIVSGALQVFSTKGTPGHKWLGRVYVAAMIAVNLSALLIYELFGSFGVFHWMALISLLTIAGGYIAVLSRTLGWKVRHAYFMSGSYVGVIAALVAEILTRTTWLPFYWAVAAASFTVFVVGLFLMFRLIPRLL